AQKKPVAEGGTPIHTTICSQEAMEKIVEKVPHNILQSEDLYQYILETSVYPRESEVLKELRHVTASHPKQLFFFLMNLILVLDSFYVGQLMAMLLKLVNARRTNELGVYTGHSLLLTALTIPEDGKLLQNHENEGSFDFAFVDADKVNYWNYHERLMNLIKVGGLVV
ncbi:hypothetical protein CMV_029841, partial [Castanea mollissima]